MSGPANPCLSLTSICLSRTLRSQSNVDKWTANYKEPIVTTNGHEQVTTTKQRRLISGRPLAEYNTRK